MAKGGLSKRTTYNKGSGHRITITQNTKNGTTHSYSDGCETIVEPLYHINQMVV